MMRADMERIAADLNVRLHFREKPGKHEVTIYDQGVRIYLGVQSDLEVLTEAAFKAKMAKKLATASEE